MDPGNYRGHRISSQFPVRGRDRGRPTNDWRLGKLLDDWEQEQIRKEREMELIAKKQDQKEFTKDLAKILSHTDKNRKRRASTSSESSMGSMDSPTSSNSSLSSPEKKEKKKRKRRKKKTRKKEDNELQKTLLVIQKNSEKLHKDIKDLRESHNSAQESIHSHIQTIQEDVKSLSTENEKLHMAYHQLKKDIETNRKQLSLSNNSPQHLVRKKPEDTKKANSILISDNDSSGAEDALGKGKKDTGPMRKSEKSPTKAEDDNGQDDKGFDLALEFNLTACQCKRDVNNKFKGANGTAKLKQYCKKANIDYTNKNDAIKDVWAKLEPVLNIR